VNPHSGKRRPAAFLDRDGTIIVEREYLSDPDDVELLPRAANGLAALHALGFALIVVTNQSGIARGFYGEQEFHAVQAAMERLLAVAGVKLDGTYFCPHHPDFSGPCDCRKPGLALFLEAAETHHLDLAASVWIGDRVTDVLPANRLGGRGFLVRTGYGRANESQVPSGTLVLDDLVGVAEALIQGLPG
jgi:D-glycero-D-manno-heptose 1,7-bisphosphate phosphatase